MQAISAVSRPDNIGPVTRRGAATDFNAAWEKATAASDEQATDQQVAAGLPAVGAFVMRPFDDPAAVASDGEDARQVSASQGLPAGVYDFTRMTGREMTIVGHAMIATGTVQAAGMAGVLDLAAQNIDSATPINFFAYLHQQAGANEATPGGMATAFQQRASTALLNKVQSAWGVPITYDDHYPPAPRSLTADEVDAKLKAAIVTFTKEASLTPAQRMRREVLKDMELTEDQLKAMPPAAREAVEKKIGDEIARRLELMGRAGPARSSTIAGVGGATLGAA